MAFPGMEGGTSLGWFLAGRSQQDLSDGPFLIARLYILWRLVNGTFELCASFVCTSVEWTGHSGLLEALGLVAAGENAKRRHAIDSFLFILSRLLN
jgi:hypothetical protein